MKKLNTLLAQKENLLSIYFTCGYPELADTTAVISALEKNGVDFIDESKLNY